MPSYPKTICSQCCGVNGTSSDKCSACQRICSKCGGQKAKSTKQCRKCYSIEQSINPDLTAQTRTPDARKKAIDALNKFYAETGHSRVRKCPTCDIEFNARISQNYCSRKCSLLQTAAKRRNRKQMVCMVCRNNFEGVAYRESKYCSKKCWSDRRKKVACLNCKEIIQGYSKKFCSNKCCKSYQIGSKAPAWKDGKSLERDRLRLGSQVKDWRLAVFSRDGFACQKCGTTLDLHAHHIKTWAEYPDLRFDVSNGLTVCVDCHGVIHGRNFKKRLDKKKTCPVCSGRMSGKGKTCKKCIHKVKRTPSSVGQLELALCR